MQRDCNTCAHHKQGEHPPTTCQSCLGAFAWAGKYLPYWEPKKEPMETLEVSDLSPHVIVTNHKPGGAAVDTRGKAPCWTCNCGPARCEGATDTSGQCKAAPPVPTNAVLHTPAHKGIGGAPTRATTLPDVPAERKKYPVASGVLDYFPDAICAVAHLSYKGNEQHNPGKPLHWDRSKSKDEEDTMLRHFMQRGTLDTDGERHSAKMAWRALAILQKEIEAEQR